MPAKLDVNKEEVRLLVLDHGPREAARMCGLSESTVMQWSARGKWLAHVHAEPPKLPSSMQPIIVSGVSKPHQAKAERMQRECGATATAMSALALKTAVAARNMPLRIETAQDLLSLAKAHATIHRLDQGVQVGVQVNVGGLAVD